VSDIDRRAVLRIGLLGLALVGGSVGTTRLAAGASSVAESTVVDEIYRGRHIRVVIDPLRTVNTANRIRVYIDDAELHVMPLEDGSYTSVMNHYQSFGTALLAARAAVDNLHGAALLPHA
jgi:hypothetical protein